MSTTPFTPDDIYCVYCHAPAAGPCATCSALICSDCGELTGGSVKKVVVCHKCAKRGRGRVGLDAWLPFVVPAVGIAIALVVFVLIASRC